MESVMIFFGYLSPLFGIVGVLTTIVAYVKWRRLVFLPLAVVFCVPVVGKVAAWIYVDNFVPVQIDVNTWTAPIVYVNMTDPLLYGLLLVAVLLLIRDSARFQGSQQKHAE